MSVKPRFLALAAAAMTAGAVLAGPASAAHAGTVKTISSSATVCVADFGLPAKCFAFAWPDQLAPGQFTEHILTGLQVGRYVGSFTVRVGVSAAKLGYGAVYARAVERHLTFVSNGRTTNANVVGNSQQAFYWPPVTGSFTDSAKDDLNLGSPTPGSTTLSYFSSAA